MSQADKDVFEARAGQLPVPWDQEGIGCTWCCKTHFCYRNLAKGSTLKCCPVNAAVQGQGALVLQREEQGSPLLCSLQLFSFLFKEERYFQCLITRLELRLTYSPDMQQKQPLFNTPPHPPPAFTNAEWQCFPPFGDGGVIRDAWGAWRVQGCTGGVESNVSLGTWTFLPPGCLAYWEMRKHDLFLWRSKNPAWVGLAPPPSLAGG